MNTLQQIPQRRTKDFTVYAANMMLDYAQGADLECATKGTDNYVPVTFPAWDWWGFDYRIKPITITG